MAVGVSRVVQGQAETFTVTLSGGTYSGSETLAATIGDGSNNPALLSLTPVYTPGQSFPATPATVDIALTSAQLATLAVGGYVLSVTVNGAGGYFGALRVYPAAGSTLSYRSLVTPGMAMMLLPDLTAGDQDGLDALAWTLQGATRALETYCRRWLVLTNIDRVYRPGRSRKIWLHTYPVAPGLRLQCDYTVAFTITNTALATVPIAYAVWTPTSYYSWTPSTLTLYWWDAFGNPYTAPFTLSSYATIGALVTAIQAAGSGWTATISGNGYNGIPLSAFPTNQIIYDPGTHGMVDNEQYEVCVYIRDIVRYHLDFNRGTIEITENRPEAYRAYDRAYGIGYGWSWGAAAEPRNAGVRAIYRAGYATAAADIAAGLEPVPEDLQMATIMTARAMTAAAPLVGSVSSQSVKDREYQLRSGEDLSVIPREARVILDSKYVSNRLGV